MGHPVYRSITRGLTIEAIRQIEIIGSLLTLRRHAPLQNAATIRHRKRKYTSRAEPRPRRQRLGGLRHFSRRNVASVAEFLASADSSTISCSSRAPRTSAAAILKFPLRSVAIAVSIQPRDGLQVPAVGLPVWTAQPATQSSEHLGRRDLQADGNEPVPGCGAKG